MVTRAHSRVARPAAVSAGTLFAVAAAIIAGLVCAWVFREVLLKRQQFTRPADDSVEITVAASNIYDQTEIKSTHIKRIKVDRKRYDTLSKTDKGPMLTGNQPVGRVTKVGKWIKAEEPIYEDEVYPYTYPVSVEKKLEPGWRAAIVTVPAKEAMVQVDDHVDLYCTMNSEAFGPNGNATAEMAKGAKVIARFGTTRPGAQPAKLDAPREYTLQVTPYRYALIELAKTMGAKFSLTVVPQVLRDDNTAVAPSANDINDPQEQRADRVTVRDLETLFGIAPAANVPGPWEVEKYVGIKNEGKTSYPGYVPPSQAGSPTAPASPSGAEAPSRPPQKAAPAGYSPPPKRPAPLGQLPAPSARPAATVASSSRGLGLRAPTEGAYRPYDPNIDCPT